MLLGHDWLEVSLLANMRMKRYSPQLGARLYDFLYHVVSFWGSDFVWQLTSLWLKLKKSNLSEKNIQFEYNCSFLKHILLSSLSLMWKQKFPRQMPQNLWQLWIIYMAPYRDVEEKCFSPSSTDFLFRELCVVKVNTSARSIIFKAD